MVDMYNGNHKIDNPNNKWDSPRVERLFVFCQLDRAMSYESVCRIFDGLDKIAYTRFFYLRNQSVDDISKKLKELGCRFYRQTAKYLKYNVDNFSWDDLIKMPRDEIVVKCKGFGMKLASMFHNRIHNSQYAIIDIHIDRFLQQHGCIEKDYKKKEGFLKEIAEYNGMTMEELDWKVWNENRIGNRNENRN